MSFSEFASLCERTLRLWDTAEIKALAVQGSAGYELVGLHARLGNAQVQDFDQESLTQVPHGPTAMRGIIPSADFLQLIRQLDRGTIRLADIEVGCHAFPTPDVIVLRATGDEQLRSPDLVGRWTKPWPAWFLRSYGTGLESLGVNEMSINDAMRRGRYRYDDLFHFSFETLGFGVGGACVPQIEIIAPIYIFVAARLEPGNVIIEVGAETSISTQQIFAKTWEGAYRDGLSHIAEFEGAEISERMAIEGRDLRVMRSLVKVAETLGQAVVVLYFDDQELISVSPSVEVPTVSPSVQEATPDWSAFLTAKHPESTEDISFVLMAFNRQMRRIFNEVFQPVSQLCGLVAEHSDMLPSGTVIPEIIRKIHSAKIVIADLTGHRPNVYYEIGIAHGVNPNKVILVGQVPYDEVPSDLQQQSFRYVSYGDDSDGLADLREQLQLRIEHVLGR